jgi:hypothetical protein
MMSRPSATSIAGGCSRLRFRLVYRLLGIDTCGSKCSRCPECAVLGSRLLRRL